MNYSSQLIIIDKVKVDTNTAVAVVVVVVELPQAPEDDPQKR